MVSFILYVMVVLLNPPNLSSISVRSPDCHDVCQQFSLKRKPSFTFFLWKVTCQEGMCLIMSTEYSKELMPEGEGTHKTLTVLFDLKLLKLTGANYEEDSLDLGLWVGLEWKDMNLHICDCTDLNRNKVDMNLEGQVWIPDLAIFTAKSIDRLILLTPENQFHLTKLESGGVQFYFSLDVRTTVICPFNNTWYPFDRNLCYVRFGSFSQSSKLVKFTRRHFDTRNIIYKDIKIHPKALCLEEAGIFEAGDHHPGDTLDGFKIIMNRKGIAMKNTYSFTCIMFVLTAALASLLPTNPAEGQQVDKSGVLVEACIVSYYILYDLLSQGPLNRYGKNLLINFVTTSNYFVYSSGLVYFLTLFIGRFGKMTYRLIRFIMLMSSRLSEKQDVDGGSGEVEVVAKVEILEGDLRNVEQEDLTIVERSDLNHLVCFVVSKVFFPLLMLSYWGFSNYFWLKQEMEAMSQEHHNRDTSGSCTCHQHCEKPGGH